MVAAPAVLSSSRTAGRVVAGYVPVVDLRRDAVVGVDAQAPRRSSGDPLVALREASADLRAWRGSPAPGASGAAAEAAQFGVTLDLGWRALSNPDAPQGIAAVVKAAGLEPSAVCLAVDTADVLRDVEAAVGRLRALRNVGVRLALDGFGAAEGTLRLLDRLPVDELRVDPEVVQMMPADRLAESTALALVSLAQSFGLLAVAPHVGTGPQLAKVRLLRFDRAFGSELTSSLPDWS